MENIPTSLETPSHLTMMVLLIYPLRPQLCTTRIMSDEENISFTGTPYHMTIAVLVIYLIPAIWNNTRGIGEQFEQPDPSPTSLRVSLEISVSLGSFTRQILPVKDEICRIYCNQFRHIKLSLSLPLTATPQNEVRRLSEAHEQLVQTWPLDNYALAVTVTFPYNIL
ncbi:hypothetical protein J6590_034996 [Homalodisca vitripennis]|nr:hypothetical protein J6590_034996 [Homalodisca vitripennis]